MPDSSNNSFRLDRLEQDMKALRDEFDGTMIRLTDKLSDASNKVTALLMMSGLISTILVFLLYKTIK